MKVEVIANILNEDCVADPGPDAQHPTILDLREEIAKDYIERGLVIRRRDLEENNPIERAVNANRETATHPAQKK